jgi:CBS domain-containing protein
VTKDKLDAGTLCTRIVTIATRDMPLIKAAQLMRDRHVGSLVVVDETVVGRLVVGMLTDRDIVTAVVAQAMSPESLRVEDVMTTDVVTASESDSVTDLLDTMRRKGLRRLPVTTPQGALIGVVAMDDLIQLTAEQMRAMALSIEAELLRERKARP